MNHVAEEILNNSSLTDEELMHYGMPRRSGRYPWGSGEDPHQHGSRDFLGRVDELRKEGFVYTDPKTGKTYSGDTAIAKSMGLSTTQFRTELGIAKDERRMLDVARAKSLKEDGHGASKIGEMMGVNESTVRSWLNEESEVRMKKARETADQLKKIVDEKGMVDVGAGTDIDLHISQEKLNQALYLLEREGYPTYAGRIPQLTNPNQQTTQKVLCVPGTKHGEIYDYERVHSLKEYISRDGGETIEKKFTYPASLDSKRLMIRYKEDGGVDKDGIVELRRGVDDLSLGESRYSQVRILVDGKKFIKGMAVYADDKDMPAGVDVIFNTNKSNKLSKLEVLKDIKNDPDNPFGSAIKDAEQGGQYWYTDKNGSKKLGLINKRADEGDWDDWSNALPSQFLGKQSKSMAKKQLDIAKADKQAEFDEICSINNPTIKKHFLDKFADECDSAAVHLKAAALPRQKYHVIIPINTLKDNEVYAPGYKDGETLALIRYPHGGTFEIPILTVNNKHMAAKKLLGKDVIDAVGINTKVAERLSGADFDGDTVMCIPTHDRGGKVKISSRDQLPELKGFEPKDLYSYDTKKVDADGTEHYYRNGREFKVMKNTQNEMGQISNLITDMTLAGADDDKLARAVKHSMVVIDAEKHKLDYKQSELDNNIKALKQEYQYHLTKKGAPSTGAATILSRAKGQETVLKRQGTPKVNTKYKKNGEPNPDYDPTRPEGSLIYKTADDLTYQITKTSKRTGKTTTITKERTQKSTQMAEVDDAYELVSPAKHAMELLYADYANSMKAMANSARMESFKTGKIAYSATAKKTYQKEVDSLNSKLNNALLNALKQREVLRRANVEVNAKKKAAKERGEELKNDDIKKLSTRALAKYRQEVDAATRKERSILITDREWEAIQAGAVSENTLKKILNNADTDELRKRATPRTTSLVSPAQASRIKAMSASYTLSELSEKFGVSTSTISKILKGAS